VKRLALALLFASALPGCSGGGRGGGGGAPGGGAPPGGGPGPGGAPVYTGAGSATHYYVSTTGNDGNPGTAAQPWATLDKIESVALAPGDLVHVAAGTYTVNSALSLTNIAGSAAAWIGLQAEGAVKIQNTAVQNVINVSGCSYLFLKGFEITHVNAGAYGTWDAVDGVKFQGSNSSFVSIDSCHIHSLGNVGVSSQAPLVQSITVWNCEINDCYTGLYWGYYEDVNKRYAHYGRVARNYVHDCPPVDLDGTGYGLQIKGGSRGNVIEDNVFVNVAGNTRAAIAVYHISTNLSAETDHNIIRRNVVRASRNEGIWAVEGATVENNLVVDCAQYGINIDQRNTGSWGTFYGNLNLRHNSVCRVTNASGRAMRIGSAAFTPPIAATNNLLHVAGGGQLALTGPAGFTGTASNNFCSGGSSGSNLGVVALADMSCVQSTTYGSAGFLFPTAAGVLIDVGGTATDDFNGTTRATPDAGAYESGGAGNPGWTVSDGFKP
jgi:hypothetical protein